MVCRTWPPFSAVPAKLQITKHVLLWNDCSGFHPQTPAPPVSDGLTIANHGLTGRPLASKGASVFVSR